jgi:hypothetical protein
MEVLPETDRETIVAEGAAVAADLANLAVCLAPALAEGDERAAALAASHLAAGAARSLLALAPTRPGEAACDARDARSAAWRARFAAGQADRALGIEG